LRRIVTASSPAGLDKAVTTKHAAEVGNRKPCLVMLNEASLCIV
jgi:hypothetical protein